MPQRSLPTASRFGTSVSVHIAFRRNAVFLPRPSSGWLMSIVDALVVRVADADRAVVGGAELRGLGDLIDRAAGGPAAGDAGRGALGDFDLFEVERIARVAAEVAHAVDEHVGARAEAADGHLVAGRHAAFTGLERDARDVAQHVAQRHRALLLHDGARDHGDGLRDVAQRLGVFGRGDVRHTARHFDRIGFDAQVERDGAGAGEAVGDAGAGEDLRRAPVPR